MASEAITHQGDKQAAAHVQAVGNRGGDLRGAAAKVRTVVRDAQQQRFDSGGFGSWPKLAQSTIDSKRRSGGDARLMRKTGALYKALTAARAKGQIDDRRRSELAFGTDLAYARFHQEGRGVPARDLEGFPSSVDRKLTDAMQEYVSTGR